MKVKDLKALLTKEQEFNNLTDDAFGDLEIFIPLCESKPDYGQVQEWYSVADFGNGVGFFPSKKRNTSLVLVLTADSKTKNQL